jgi:hypothetical protein
VGRFRLDLTSLLSTLYVSCTSPCNTVMKLGSRGRDADRVSITLREKGSIEQISCGTWSELK